MTATTTTTTTYNTHVAQALAVVIVCVIVVVVVVTARVVIKKLSISLGAVEISRFGIWKNTPTSCTRTAAARPKCFSMTQLGGCTCRHLSIGFFYV